MTSTDETTPRQLVHIPGSQLSSDTAQTEGMRRTAAVATGTVGSRNIWMGITDVAAGANSGAHHHGHSETGIYVVEGNPTFTYRDGDELVELHTQPGDFVYVPPYVPHMESNAGDGTARVVIARSTDEAIVENLDQL